MPERKRNLGYDLGHLIDGYQQRGISIKVESEAPEDERQARIYRDKVMLWSRLVLLACVVAISGWVALVPGYDNDLKKTAFAIIAAIVSGVFSYAAGKSG